jgi:hypothetical protein
MSQMKSLKWCSSGSFVLSFIVCFVVCDKPRKWCLSDQDRSTIDYQGLAGAEFFLHEE